MKEGKNKGGRPTKMTKELLDAMEKVITDDRVLALTNEELVFELNWELERRKLQQISYKAFEKWISGTQKDNPLFQKFLGLVKKSLAKQKQRLLKALDSGVENWQARAWILERKFDDWNLRQKTEATLKGDKRNPVVAPMFYLPSNGREKRND